MDLDTEQGIKASTMKIVFNKDVLGKMSRRQLMTLMCPSNLSHIEQAGQYHSGVLDVAHRLTKYISNTLPYGESNLLDYILSDALTSWESVYEEKGARAAYHAYCLTIRELLPLVFNYRVRSKKKLMPYDGTIWNCVAQTIFEWVGECQLNEVEVEIGSAESALTRSEMSLLISHNVFSRIDMMQWGLPPEGSFGVTQYAHFSTVET